jgi:LPXTG-motif cell wall-anchored protein
MTIIKILKERMIIMKKMRRFAALLLAMIMVLAMGMTAMATEEKEPTAQTWNLKINAASGHTYKVYQLLVGDVSSDKKLSNVKIGASAGSMAVKDIEDAVKDKTGTELSKAASNLVKDMQPVATITATEAGIQNVKINESEDVPTGYYVITDEYIGTGNPPTGVTTTLSATMVQLVADLTIEPKDSDIPTQPTKTVADAQRTVSIGDDVTYTLGGAIPSMANYETYKYVLVDTLSKGLQPKVTKDQEIPVKLQKDDANDVDATFVVTKVEKDSTTGKTEVRFALKDAINYKNNTGYTFSFTYTATVMPDADFAANSTVVALENKVKVVFPNSPDNVGEGDDFGPNDITGETVETTETVYSAKFGIHKINGETKEALQGAEFELAGEGKKVGYVTGQTYVASESGEWYKLDNGSYTTTEPTNDTGNRYEVVDGKAVKYALQDVNKPTTTETITTEAKAFVDANGNVSFTGLGEGTYTITEVTTPDGYNSIEPIKIKIEFNTEAKTFSAYVLNADGDKTGDAINMAAYEIENKAGTVLPSTGGIGTTIFYVVGGILVLGAGVLLITKKRMSARD